MHTNLMLSQNKIFDAALSIIYYLTDCDYYDYYY